MYKILIADDEEIERRALKMMIYNSIPEVEKVVEACNGIELIKKCEGVHFDVLIVDISMPGINGLEAVGMLRDKGDTSKIIIYTAHGEFEYAREALQYHANEYLLKPAKREKIITTIRQCLKQVEEEHALKQQNDYLKGLMKEISPMIETEFVTELISDEPDTNKLHMYTQAIGFGGHGGSMVTFLIKNKQQAVETKGYTKKELAKRIGIELKELGDASSYLQSNELLIAYVPTKEGYTGYRFKMWIMELVEIILQKVQDFHYLDIKVGIGMPYERLEDVHQSYQESLKALYHVKDRRQIRYYNNSEEQQEVNLFELYTTDLLKAIQEHNVKRCQLLIERIVKEYKYNSLLEVKDWALEWLLSVIHQLGEQQGADFEDRLSINTLCEQNRQVETSEQLITSLIKSISLIVEHLKGEEEQDSNQMIETVKAYINNHYKEELSLERLAEKVQISPYYLSKVFKQATGEKFVDYVNRVRIAKAKALLSQYDYSVTDLSLKVGYNSTTYFCKVFKKLTGKTVGEFKHD